MIVFVHIPKTAGTTFRTVLGQQFLPHQIFPLYEAGGIPDRVRRLGSYLERGGKRYRLVQGHVGYGVHRHLPCKCRYITVLRDPVRRVVSMYRHILRHPTHHQYDAVRRMSITDYVESGVDESACDSQTRFVSDEKLARQMARAPDQPTFGNGAPAMIRDARENLGRMAMVGIAERFDETMLGLQATVGFRTTYYARLNRAPRSAPVTDAEYDAIRARNTLDTQLYSRGNAILDEVLQGAYPDIESALHRFRRANRLLGPLVTYPTRAVHTLYERVLGVW